MSDSTQNTYVAGRCNTPPLFPPTRRTGRSMSDFLYSGALDTTDNTLSALDGDTTGPTARLCEGRLRFMKKIPIDFKSKLCSPRDRRAALMVYEEAIKTIKSTNVNHIDVEKEAEAKIQIILGIERADPSNRVFQKNHLSPIEPLYAEPRIKASDDTWSYHASWRLHEWRKDGWPGSYPDGAIDKEKTMEGHPKRWRDQDWSDELSDNLANPSGKTMR